jgi:hypothetical protein
MRTNPCAAQIRRGTTDIATCRANNATGRFSSISGGPINQANGSKSWVGGGALNIASGESASIFGGKEHTAATSYEAIP